MLWYGSNVLRKVEATMSQKVERACIFLQGEVEKKLTGARSGKQYKRGGKTHTASAPGEPPTVDYGRLRGSITYATDMGQNSAVRSPALDEDGINKVGKLKHRQRGIVGTNVKYGLMLETGTVNMQPRPWLKNTYLENKGRIKDILA